eukprot:2048509-Rhodomonas_salina.1
MCIRDRRHRDSGWHGAARLAPAGGPACLLGLPHRAYPMEHYAHGSGPGLGTGPSASALFAVPQRRCQPECVDCVTLMKDSCNRRSQPK